MKTKHKQTNGAFGNKHKQLDIDKTRRLAAEHDLIALIIHTPVDGLASAFSRKMLEDIYNAMAMETFCEEDFAILFEMICAKGITTIMQEMNAKTASVVYANALFCYIVWRLQEHYDSGAEMAADITEITMEIRTNEKGEGCYTRLHVDRKNKCACDRAAA